MPAIHSYGPVSLTWIEGKGRGVVANRPLAPDATPIHSPVVVLSDQDLTHTANTSLNNYVFHWPFDLDGSANEQSKNAAMVCGLGSMLNHSDQPNCDWDYNGPNLQHLIRVVKPVDKDEELTVNYGWDPEQAEQLVESRVDVPIIRQKQLVYQLTANQPLRIRPLRGGALLINRQQQFAVSRLELAAIQAQLRPSLIRRGV